MSDWQKYQHLERLDSEEVEGILDMAQIWVEAKIDGANASVVLDRDGILRAAKRSQVLGDGVEFRGLVAYVYERQQSFLDFFAKYPNTIIYGEWLVPHSLKVYRKDAWNKFYAFDILDLNTFEFIQPDTRVRMLAEFGIEMVTPIVKIVGPIITDEDKKKLQEYVESNRFLIDEPNVVGEGVVIKAYDKDDKAYRNKYGRITWGKIVRQEFKEKNAIEFGAREVELKDKPEQIFADTFITSGRVEKCKQKIADEEGTGWRAQYIGKLLGMVYYDAFREELPGFVKEHKVKKMDFSALNQYCVLKVKAILGL